MTHATWLAPSKSRDDLQVFLTSAGFEGQIDLCRPEQGVEELKYCGDALPTRAVLAAEVCGAGQADALTDWYIRGDDLIAAYAAEQPHPSRSQIYWRRLAAEEAPPSLGLELIVSVQTDLLHSEPRLTAASRVQAAEVWRLSDAQTDRFARLPITPRGPTVCPVDQGPGVFVFRSPESQFSYAQMLHPSDFQGAVISPLDVAGGPELRLAHELFGESLKKGVIRRGRVRGWLLPRGDDLAAAAQRYRQWLAEPPPLTT